jgi:uncharacterized protein YjbJ (UPF0337 family)
MDEDRMKGSVQKIAGDVKVGAGKALGDQKLQAEGRSDQVGGKIRNAIGGIKDAFRQATGRREPPK